MATGDLVRETFAELLRRVISAINSRSIL
jgi:hypothetical protein